MSKVIKYYDLTISCFNMEQTFFHITEERMKELKKHYPSKQFKRRAKFIESIIIKGE